MSNELVRQQLEGTLQAQSLSQLVQEKKTERGTFLLIDCSGSMAGSVKEHDSHYEPPRRGERKIDAMREVVAKVREHVECKVVGFGIGFGRNAIQFCHDSIPDPGGDTPLGEAIRFAQQHGAMRLVVISDGMPDSEEAAMLAAREFPGAIDVFYVGPRPHYGEEFLSRLAAASKGGRYAPANLAQPAQLTSAIRGLLAPGRKG